MFQFPWFPSLCLCIQHRILQVCCSGFPHSGIPGSQPACGSPRHIAAYRALHRLLVPRHPPCALFSLTFLRSTMSSRSSCCSKRSTVGLRPPPHFRSYSLTQLCISRCRLATVEKSRLAPANGPFYDAELYIPGTPCEMIRITYHCTVFKVP